MTVVCDTHPNIGGGRWVSGENRANRATGRNAEGQEGKKVKGKKAKRRIVTEPL